MKTCVESKHEALAGAMYCRFNQKVDRTILKTCRHDSSLW